MLSGGLLPGQRQRQRRYVNTSAAESTSDGDRWAVSLYELQRVRWCLFVAACDRVDRADLTASDLYGGRVTLTCTTEPRAADVTALSTDPAACPSR